MKDMRKIEKLLEKNRVQEAIDLLSRLKSELESRENPDTRDLFYVCYNLGACYESAGEFIQAIEVYEIAGKLKQNDPDVVHSLGKCYYQIEEFQKAEEIFSSLINREDFREKSDLYNDLGVLCYVNGRVDEAKEFFNRAVTEDPENRNASFNLKDIS